MRKEKGLIQILLYSENCSSISIFWKVKKLCLHLYLLFVHDELCCGSMPIIHMGCVHEVVSFSGSSCHQNKALLSMACSVSLAIWRVGGMFCNGIDGFSFSG